MNEQIWDKFLTARDKQVFASAAYRMRQGALASALLCSSLTSITTFARTTRADPRVDQALAQLVEGNWCCLTPCPSPTRVKQRTLVKHRSRARLGANVRFRQRDAVEENMTSDPAYLKRQQEMAALKAENRRLQHKLAKIEVEKFSLQSEVAA